MTPRARPWLAWSLSALSLAFLGGSLALEALSWGIESPAQDLGAAGIGWVIGLLAFWTMGLLLTLRRPENTIGWLLAASGVVLTAAVFAPAYADYALFAKPASLPGGRWLAWVSGWLDPLFICFPAALLLVFPTGRLLTRRWRPIAWLVVAVAVLGVVFAAFRSGPIREGDLPVPNPLGIDGAGAFFDAVGLFVWLGVVTATVAAAMSMVVRFRRARGAERQQLKWMAFAAALLGIAFVAANAVAAAGHDSGESGEAADVLLGIAIAGLPVSAGVAILRYRLYDIDRIVNRTLVYGALTAALAGLYFGLVLALQQVFSSFAGGSDLAIAGSTLAVAALFRPARRRIQELVDRRFYRRRYDTQQTLEAFSAHLRDEVALDALSAELRSVVQRTMQPAHVSLWLREPANGAVTPAVTIPERPGGRKDSR
jgi:hypothetical protein